MLVIVRQMASAPAPEVPPQRSEDAMERTKRYLYSRQLLQRSYAIPSYLIGVPAIRELSKRAKQLEGKCTAEGLVRLGSTNIIEHSAGACDGALINYDCKVECDICSPVPGQRINKCKIVSITKMGIRAIKPPEPGPLTIFVLRDHYGMSEYYQSLQEGDEIDILVTAPRFQLNDSSVTVLADLIPKQPFTRSLIQPN
jgi:hypothetical protein